MELKQLRQFHEVCERGSFSAAGESLYMTQQAIGKSMRLLEEELGVILFIRAKSGVTLTPQGEFLKERSRELLQYVKETEHQIQQIGAHCPLRTRVALMAGMEGHARLHEETMAHALFDTKFIDTVICPDDRCEQEVLEEKAGAAIVLAPVQDEQLQAYPLLHIPVCLVVPEDNTEFTKKELTLKDLRQKSLILVGKPGRAARRLFGVFKEQNIRPKEIHHVENVKEAFACCREKQGFLLLPQGDFVQLAPRGLRAIPLKQRSFSLNLFFVFRKEDACQKELMRVYEYLKSHCLL